MQGRFRKSAAALALLASVSLASTPAMARGWGGWGWGWGGGWGRHHDRVDAGDVITGILIIGGIAAIASAASDNGKRARERDRREREDRDWRGEDRDESGGYGDDDRRPEWREGSGINAAVERCVSELERGSAKVEGVEAVNKQGDGWRVEGRMSGGQSFACAIDADGRIRSATVGGAAY